MTSWDSGPLIQGEFTNMLLKSNSRNITHHRSQKNETSVLLGHQQL